MGRWGFLLAMAAGFFTVFLLGWRGYHGASADWVYGFLAVFWSLIMMLRLMTLTEPADTSGAPRTLAQKLVENFRERQEENRQSILENSFGGSYLLFLLAGFLFAAWQIFCASFPAQQSAFDGLSLLARDFFGGGASLPFFEGRIFDWGQGFLMILALAMMGFVLRSHAAHRGQTRAALIILCGYAVAFYIAFAGLEPAGNAVTIHRADITGNGAGAATFLLGTLAEGKTYSFFDIVLLESGIAGLALLTFILFIPLGYITLSAQGRETDWLVVGCGMIAGSVLILSVFLSFTPALGGFMALCWMALFLAWGGAENRLSAIPA